MNSSMLVSKGRAIRRRLGGRIKAMGWLLPVPLPAFHAVHLQTYQEFVDYREREREVLENRLRLMWEMARPGGIITTRGYCICCRQASEFVTDAEAHRQSAAEMPAWREGLLCPGCGLNSRIRASVHLMLWASRPRRRSRIFLTEQVTPLYRWVKDRYPLTEGSEYLRDGTIPGKTNGLGIRHEDLTALSLPDRSVDVIVSLEVLEHIPDFHAALAQCARVLTPGGKMILSVPFHRGPEHLVRAQLKADGSIEHLLPPEYHNDPLDVQGCLCFHHFGWDVIDFLRQAGFRSAAGYSIWSAKLGYIAGDGDMIQFVAEK